MEASDFLKKILDRHRLSQVELAALINVAAPQMTRYLSGQSEPNSLACILLVTLSDSDDEKRFWLKASGLGHDHLTRLASALNISPQASIAGEEQDLLDWWRAPADAIEKSLKQLVGSHLKVRKAKAKKT
jgi:transcriptional regulator with XRE-family HTH domain